MRKLKISISVLVFILLSLYNLSFASAAELSNEKIPVQIQKAAADNFPYNTKTQFSVDGSKPFVTKGQYMQNGSLMVNANQLGEMLGIAANFKKFYPHLMFSTGYHDYYFQDKSDEIAVKQVDSFKMDTYTKFVNGIVYTPANYVVNCFSAFDKIIYSKDKNTVYLFSDPLNNSEIITGEKKLEYIAFSLNASTKIYYNDKLIYVPKQYIVGNSVTYKSYNILTVPLYKVINAMGGSTVYGKRKDYCVNMNTITAAANDRTIVFSDNDNYVYAPNLTTKSNPMLMIKMDYKARIMSDNRIYVPISIINYFCDNTKTIYDKKNNEIRFYH